MTITLRARIGGVRQAFLASPGHVIALSVLAILTLTSVLLLLFQHPLTLRNQPFPDAHEYLNAAYRFAHGHGYTTTVRDNLSSPHIRQPVNPPRYPPGTSVVLAPFALIGSYPANVEFGAKVIVVALVLATGWAGYSLGGWYPALLAALVTSVSPFATHNAQVVMSDALATLLAVVCVPLMTLRAKWAIYLAGFFAGYGFVCREAGLVVIVCLLIVLRGSDRLRVAAGAVAPMVGLAIYNWSAFGAPWRTGYSYWLVGFNQYSPSYVLKHPWPPGGEQYYASSLQLFHLVGNSSGGAIGTLPNLWFYPLIALGFSAVFGPPLLTLVGLFVAIRSWRRREARFTLILAAGSVLFFMPEYSQDPRYMAAPCVLLTVWATVGLVELTRRMWRRYGAVSPTKRADLSHQRS
jgi:hypothetical protein